MIIHNTPHRTPIQNSLPQLSLLGDSLHKCPFPFYLLSVAGSGSHKLNHRKDRLR